MLSRTEADRLLQMEKQRKDNSRWEYPQFGGSIRVPLVSASGKEDFMLDIGRGKIDLRKGELQNRARNIIVLARLDYGGSPHRNPDGEEIGGIHLHLYREGYDDKWAYPVDPHVFTSLDNAMKTLDEFMRFCNVTEPPIINAGLFT
uniref:Uncharacterized protein n=1 Tax=Candidatus Kentrum sp. TUN TaxID=2126343 RepID=A0A450ZEE3_9GAMM|nr:MAG: hypothetical protein BECKTUN1418D_GA0071000_100332 [Candidatus Kentron sp. TUN]VFK52107.1 MAG: hypothetical protein BECKTUN1418E_GA0071001_100726 [Candidatus Kentron sp. TUN]VFK52149.1 MAG: hypothetical protein BECKTUN1418F_GA0071002_100525 [Candidatus Kentron sp. TUN]